MSDGGSFGPNSARWYLWSSAASASSTKWSIRRASRVLSHPETSPTWSTLGLVRLVQQTGASEQRTREPGRLRPGHQISANGSGCAPAKRVAEIGIGHDYCHGPVTIGPVLQIWERDLPRLQKSCGLGRGVAGLTAAEQRAAEADGHP